jgi:hypothetical protein
MRIISLCCLVILMSCDDVLFLKKEGYDANDCRISKVFYSQPLITEAKSVNGTKPVGIAIAGVVVQGPSETKETENHDEIVLAFTRDMKFAANAKNLKWEVLPPGFRNEVRYNFMDTLSPVSKLSDTLMDALIKLNGKYLMVFSNFRSSVGQSEQLQSYPTGVGLSANPSFANEIRLRATLFDCTKNRAVLSFDFKGTSKDFSLESIADKILTTLAL